VTTLVLTTAFARAAPVMGAFLFARYLHTHGEQAVFASLDYTPSGFRDEIVASGVPIHSFRLGGWTGMRKRGVVQKYVDARGIDVVMSDGLRPDIVASGLRGITRVSNVRGLLREHYALDYPIGVAQAATWAQARALKKLDGVFAISPEIAAHLTDLGISSDRIRVVDNFIDVEVVVGAGHGGPDLDTGVHIGLFGALIRRKRIDVALRGFAGLFSRAGHVDATLYLAGDGPLRSQLAKLAGELGISERVVFHGFLAQPLPLMAKMDIVLLTSDREGVHVL
jgi:glycosyltransferase involved in cell wall biosynthesis